MRGPDAPNTPPAGASRMGQVRMGGMRKTLGRRENALPTVAAATVVVVGVLVLLGWLLDIAALRTFLPGVTNPMVASTAFCFVLLGVALWLLHREGERGAQWWVGKACALFAAGIGLLKLSEYAFGWDLGIDQTLFTKNPGAFPGQMAVPTALSFVLVGSALLVLDVEIRRRYRPAQILTLLGALLPILGLIGRFYDVPTLSSFVGGTVVMALHTALTFLALCAGVLAARPNAGIMKVISSEGPGGMLLRRLLPGAVAVIVLAGWFRLLGEHRDLYGREMGTALFVVVNIILLSGLIWRSARFLYRSDIAQRLARDSLAESEERLRAVLASIAEGVLVTDPDGLIVSLNPAMERLAGWPEAEARGQTYEAAFPLLDANGERLSDDDRFLQRAISTRRVVMSRGHDISLLAREGRQVPVSITAAPILDREGTLVGGVDIIRDVSYEREVDELKSSLISTVSHELRTPLTMIQGFSELLLSRELGADQSRQALEQINTSSERLSRLINDLLTVSRLDSGRIEIRPEPVDLGAVLRETTDPFRKGREIHIDVNGVSQVLADRDRLVQILTNLVSNAVKYSPPDAPVSVTATRQGTTAAVAVQDRGMGMTEEEVKRLFDKFYRVDRADVREIGGTGLGLYITKHLVELHGGEISVESKPGVGSTFVFTLPVPAGDAEAKEPAGDAEAKESA
jgi:two-component system phosphate regulon sensor histidine kinase PhoR